MRKYVLLITVIILIKQSYSQSQSVGIINGINISNISANKVFTDVENRKSYLLGLNYNYYFKGKPLIESNIIYSKQGFNDEFTLTDITGIPTGEYHSIEFTYDYVSLPIKAGIRFGKQIKIVPKVGIQPSLLIKARTTNTRSYNWTSYSIVETIDVKDNVSKVDIAGLLELGFEYQLKQQINLTMSIAGKYSFTKSSNSNYFEDFEMRHKVMLISFGVNYILN